MKKIVLLLCAMLAFSLTAEEVRKEEINVEKRLAELQAERTQTQKTLIQHRRKAIRADKYAAKLAREILTLNQQLSEYLDTKQDIKKLNQDLAKIDRQIKELKQIQAEQNKKANAKK